MIMLVSNFRFGSMIFRLWVTDLFPGGGALADFGRESSNRGRLEWADVGFYFHR